MAKDPKEVGLIEPAGGQSEPTDCGGLQSGRADCAGLLFTVKRVSQTMWANAGYTGHSCGTCRQGIAREGSGSSVQAAVVSGVTATRLLKCTVLRLSVGPPRVGRGKVRIVTREEFLPAESKLCRIHPVTGGRYTRSFGFNYKGYILKDTRSLENGR